MSAQGAARDFVRAMLERRPDPYEGADLSVARRVTAALLALAGVGSARRLLPADEDAERGGPLFARPTRALAALGAIGFCVALAEEGATMFLVDAYGTFGQVTWLSGAPDMATVTLGVTATAPTAATRTWGSESSSNATQADPYSRAPMRRNAARALLRIAASESPRASASAAPCSGLAKTSSTAAAAIRRWGDSLLRASTLSPAACSSPRAANVAAKSLVSAGSTSSILLRSSAASRSPPNFASRRSAVRAMLIEGSFVAATICGNESGLSGSALSARSRSLARSDPRLVGPSVGPPGILPL